MSPEQLCTVTNTTAVVGWLLPAVLPGRRRVTDVVTGKVLPALFAALYISGVVPRSDSAALTSAPAPRRTAM